jgi:outer membrane protein assembly factor BamB
MPLAPRAFALLSCLGLLSAASAQFGAPPAAPTVPPLEALWQAAAEGGFYAPPTVVGETVYAAGLSGKVLALGAADGKPLWTHDTGSRCYAGLAVAKGLVFGATADKTVFALGAADGKPRWQRTLDGLIYATPALDGSVLVCATGESGTVYGLEAASGAVRWTFKMGARAGSGLAVAGPLVYVGSFDHKVYCLQAADGQPLWQFETEGIVDSAPLATGGKVYVKLPSDTVYALDAATGHKLWAYHPAQAPIDPTKISNWSPLTIAHGLLLFGSVDYNLYALDAATGTKRWTVSRPDALPACPAVVGATGVVGGKDNTLCLVDLRSGEATPAWSSPQPQGDPYLRGVMWPPVIAGERLFASSMDGHLYAFTTHLTARSAQPPSKLAAPSLTAQKIALHDLAGRAEGEYRLSADLDWAETWPAAATVGLVLDAGADGSAHLLTVGPNSVRLARQAADGKAAELATAKLAAPPHRLLVQRDGWRIRLVADDRLVLTAFDAAPDGGAAAAGSNSDDVTVLRAKLQPTETLYFSDDFMRTAGSAGDWRPKHGEWTVTGVSEENVDDPNKRPRPDFSANPFAYRANNVKTQALATVGEWFWDSYRYEASVRPSAVDGPDPAVGLVACWHDDANYLAFEWHRGGGGERQLVAVRDGRRNLLASADGAWTEDQWYRLGLQLLDGRVTATIDGQDVLTATTDAAGGGPVGLWAQQVAFADFDDSVVQALDGLHDGFEQPRAGLWQSLGGSWADDARGPFKVQRGDGGGRIVTGRADWRDYQVRCNGRCGNDSGLGLVACWRDANNYLAFDWRAPDRLELTQVVDGKATLLASAKRPLPRWVDLHLGLDAWRGRVRGSVEGQVVLEAFAPGAGGGKAGLTSFGNRTAFRFCDVELEPVQPPVEFEPEVAPQFSQEELMADWARPEGAWIVEPQNARPGFDLWYRSEVYGPTDYGLDAKNMLGDRAHNLRLAIASDIRRPEVGYEFILDHPKGAAEASFELKAGGQSVATAKAPIAGLKLLTLTNLGRLFELYGDERLLLSWTDPRPDPALGARFGMASSEQSLDATHICVHSANCLDTTFSHAPVEWWESKGIWETTNRWKCDPRWSFFGGHEDRNPTIWSKDDFGGDQQLDAWMGIRMDTKSGSHYFHPSDLAITICGNGAEVTSGYSLIFAANNNQASWLYRNGHRIAVNDSAEARFRYTSSDGEGLTEFHRHWFHLMLRRARGRLTAAVDDHQLFDLPDDQPLPGGKIAIYDANNGVMVTRARLAYSQSLPRAAVLDYGTLTARADRGGPVADPFHNDFETGIGEFHTAEPRGRVVLTRVKDAYRGTYALALTNGVSGGRFAVRPFEAAFNAKRHPVLSFAYKLPPTARLNLYFTAGGQRYVVVFSGGDEVLENDRVIGRIADVKADEAWHEARFDLAAALVKDRGSADVACEGLMFAMDEPDPYLHAGFSANPAGCTWYLDDFDLAAKG